MADEIASTRVKIWDLPVRIFHWSLLLLIALQYLSGEFSLLSMQWHFWLGYATLVLIAFRILWGFFGSQSARFASFVRGPVGVARYLRSLFSNAPQRSLGHNPLGGWSVLALLLCVLVQALTGLCSGDDVNDEAGPLAAHVSAATARWMTHLHHLNQNILLLLIAIHVVAVLLYWLLRGENLTAAMLTGRKAMTRDPQLGFVGNGRAVVLFLLSAGAVIALVWWGNQAAG